ncbi:MAG: VWA domain-containing protein [Deltaproteobacteria bacterium]|nr:VWA domain-containing protein [Deltaproteobacteria bacterium]
MKKKIALWSIILLFTGCGSSISTSGDTAQVQQAQSKNDSDNSQIAVDDPDGGEIQSVSKFTARPFADKNRLPLAPAADLNTLPPLKMRLNRCFAPPVQKTPPQPIMPYASMGMARGGSGMGSGMASGGLGIKSSPKKRAKSSPAGDSSNKMASAPAMMESAPQQSAPAPSKGNRSEAKRESMAESEMAQDMVAAADNDDEMAIAESPQEKNYDDFGASIYLSNDDSMSLSSAQRVMYEIDNFLPLNQSEIRPHELLNYFSFDTAKVKNGHDFSVYPTITKDENEDGIYSLGLSVTSRPVTKENRRNVDLTWVIDRSGSMEAEGRMKYLKQGLLRSLDELKEGDMVHMVLFDHQICTPVENFVVGRDDMNLLKKTINKLKPEGGTDLQLGLNEGYKIADASYQRNYSNRVVLITDALTNTGIVDEDMISTISKYYDSRQIRLSGIGVGRTFNDSLLDKLTERGKGAYLFLGSQQEVDAVFGQRFISIIETIANDTHFRLHLPESLKMNVFYGEESSTVKEDVQAVHYFANSTQLFLQDVKARNTELKTDDDIMLTIEYKDPETNSDLFEEYAFNLGDITKNDPYNSKKGRFIMAFIDMLTIMSQREIPSNYISSANSWKDPEAYTLCQDGKDQLNNMAKEITKDGEITRVIQLWDKYCSRYDRPANPVIRDTVKKRTPAWPGTTPEPMR